MNNKPHAGSAGLDCDSQLLSTLLDHEETHPNYSTVASHVEACSACQKRLEQLAADSPQWEMAGNLLRESSDDDCGADELRITQELRLSKEVTATNDRRLMEHLREVLSEPKHPEMLGRLGRYDIESVVGRGGMGIVLRAFDTELHRPVAIKILASHLAHSGPARQRFARESRAAAAVVHEHVVAIHDVQTDGDTPFLVMQYVAGESLQARVDRQGPLTTKETLRIGMQAAAGLHAAHTQGVVHRDIKPANILLEPGVERAMVTDFGLARTVDEASLTQTGIVAGSPHYMSPEQAQGRPTDARTDLFSLGAVLYFMATGHPPFRAEQAMAVLNRICHEPHRPVWEANPEIPDELSDIIDRCLHKKETRRFTNAAELHEVLSRVLAKLQQHPPRTAARKLVRRLSRQCTLPRVAFAAATLLATVAMGLFVVQTTRIKTKQSNPQQTVARSINPSEQFSAPETPRSYSIEIWTQASAKEQLEWDDQIDQMHKSLSPPIAAPSSFTVDAPRISADDWAIKLYQLTQALDQIDRGKK